MHIPPTDTNYPIHRLLSMKGYFLWLCRATLLRNFSIMPQKKADHGVDLKMMLLTEHITHGQIPLRIG
jgi:hypothetical protein